MDFRIPGLPHSVVKHAQSTSVRELIQKIDNHPDRHALHQDLRQNQAYNPFSPESKKMIQKVGNIELFELLATDPKTQCKACLSYWSAGIVYCTCGHFLQETEANRGFIKYTMDILSIQCAKHITCAQPCQHIHMHMHTTLTPHISHTTHTHTHECLDTCTIDIRP